MKDELTIPIKELVPIIKILETIWDELPMELCHLITDLENNNLELYDAVNE